MSDWVNPLVTMGPQAGPAEAAPQATAAAPHRPDRSFNVNQSSLGRQPICPEVPEFSRQAVGFRVAFSLDFIYACTDNL
jgi:hypothetical protein